MDTKEQRQRDRLGLCPEMKIRCDEVLFTENCGLKAELHLSFLRRASLIDVRYATARAR